LDPIAKAIKIDSFRLNADYVALGSNPTSEGNCKKPNVGADIDDRRAGNDMRLKTAHVPSLNHGFIGPIDGFEQDSSRACGEKTGAADTTVQAKKRVLNDIHDGVPRRVP
jgi:hypothetical protein